MDAAIASSRPQPGAINGRSEMGLLFEGLKVIDCGSFIAAPAAATILSDFGADVIKIEPPGAGDPYRHLTKLPGHPKSDQNYAWMLGSRNKRSLAVDMAKPEGKIAIQRLASQADVFITNYPAAVRKKLGIGYEALSGLNDRLIYASFSGYGENGAEATKPGFDVTAWWARSGLMDTVRASSESVPVRPANGMGDHSAGFTLYSGIVMALYQRQSTGKGTEVSSSLVANGLWANGYNAQAAVEPVLQLIVGQSVTPAANDKQQIEPMVQMIEQQSGQRPTGLLADSGYCSEKNLAYLAALGQSGDPIETYIATGKQKHDEYRQPCSRGPLARNATRVDRMKRKLQTRAGRAIYATRKTIVEPVFGQIKQARGFRQFLLRGRVGFAVPVGGG